MGNLTAKTSGELASFMTPAKTNIKSLKVHFSPKQLGTGDPSPENVREIEGWGGVEVTKSSVNLLDQSYITEASGWILSSDDGNTIYCGVPVYKGNVNKFYTKFKSSYPFIGNPFKENVQYNVSVWLKTVSDNSFQGLKFGFKYTDGTSSLGGIFSVNNTWKRQTVTSKANKTVSGIYCTYNNSGEIYLCGLAVCEKEFDDINIVHSSTANDISYQWKKLPDEYQEVEYIENTGTQYLLTNLIFRKDLENPKIEWKHMQIVNPINDNMLFGYTATGGAVYFEYYQGAVRGYAGIGGIRYTNAYYPSSLGLNEIATCSMDKEKLILNGIEINPNGTYTDLTTVNPMSIFAWTKTDGTSGNYINKGVRIYYLRFLDGNNLMANFIPCYRKSDNEIGMYDTVSQTFYTNQGTGEFLKGEDVFSDTVYGGYVDLISGELVEEYKQVIIDSSNTWNTSTNYLYRGGYLPSVGGKNAYVKTLCSHLKNPYDVTTAITVAGTTGNLSVGKNFFDLINIEMTSDAFNQYLETQYNNGTPLQICYLLETPISHQLTPTQFESLVGRNNFWSNADYVEIEYDLIETKDIQKCRKKIMLNQPHTESVINDIVNFTTDMKAPLKECKVYFEPVQEGSGEPSLDNVRDIVGWNEVNIYNDPKYGGNIIWNQLYNYGGSTGTNGGITYTKLDNGTWEIKGTSNTTSGTAARRRQIQSPSWEANHVYWFSARAVGEGTQYLQMVLSNSGSIRATTTLYNGAFVKPTTSINQFSFRVLTQDVTVDAIARPQIVDLTKLFGEEMANYIYNLEVSKSGAGKEYFFNLFPKDWYEYNAGELTTVSAINREPCISTSISWADEAGTRYGGYVDLVKGELVIDWIYFLFSRSSKVSDYGTSADGLRKWMTLRITHNVPPYQITPDNGDNYGMFSIGNWRHSVEAGKNRAYVNSTYVYAIITTDIEDLTTAEGRTAYFDRLETNNIPIEVVYKRATPLHYQLTPQQLLAFKGTNNIWSNTNGQTEVKFWTH